jgi:hypothetical protein
MMADALRRNGMARISTPPQANLGAWQGPGNARHPLNPSRSLGTIQVAIVPILT